MYVLDKIFEISFETGMRCNCYIKFEMYLKIEIGKSMLYWVVWKIHSVETLRILILIAFLYDRIEKDETESQK